MCRCPPSWPSIRRSQVRIPITSSATARLRASRSRPPRHGPARCGWSSWHDVASDRGQDPPASRGAHAATRPLGRAPPRRRRGAGDVRPARGGRARARGTQCRPRYRDGGRRWGRSVLTVRPAVVADVPGLRRLYAALQAELAAAYPVPYPGHASEDLDSFTLLAARRLEQDPTLLFYVAMD